MTTHSNYNEEKFNSVQEALQEPSAQTIPPNEQLHLKHEVSPLITLKQFCSIFSWPSESAMRAYIYRASELGLKDAFVRVSRRVLVDPQKFFCLIRKLEQSHSKQEKTNENNTGATAVRLKKNN